MAEESPETTYVPEVKENARKEEERRVVEEGTALWRRRKEELQRQKHREQRELQKLFDNYSPWGKPGGGAPCPATLRKKNVPLEPPSLPKCSAYNQGWVGDSAIERPSKRSIDPLAVTDMNKLVDSHSSRGVSTNLRLVQDSRNRYNEEVQVYELTGGVELVPLLTSKRHYSHPQTTRYFATDATRPGYTIESLRALGVGNREYIGELSEQIRRKEENAMEERRLEKETSRRHFDTWRRFWGRPGHGAPMDHAQRKNLYNILYRPFEGIVEWKIQRWWKSSDLGWYVRERKSKRARGIQFYENPRRKALMKPIDGRRLRLIRPQRSNIALLAPGGPFDLIIFPGSFPQTAGFPAIRKIRF